MHRLVRAESAHLPSSAARETAAFLHGKKTHQPSRHSLRKKGHGRLLERLKVRWTRSVHHGKAIWKRFRRSSRHRRETRRKIHVPTAKPASWTRNFRNTSRLVTFHLAAPLGAETTELIQRLTAVISTRSAEESEGHATSSTRTGVGRGGAYERVESHGLVLT